MNRLQDEIGLWWLPTWQKLLQRFPFIDEYKQELQDHFKYMIKEGLQNCDLVTREEFNVQVRLLEQTQKKVAILEQQLRLLEQTIQA